MNGCFVYCALLISALACATLPAAAQNAGQDVHPSAQAGPASLRQVLDAIAARAPEVLAAQAAASGAAAQQRQARAAWFGKLDAYALSQHFNDPRLTRPITQPPNVALYPFGADQSGYGLDLQLPLDSNRQIAAEVDAARARASGAQWSAEDVRLRALLQGATLFRNLQALAGQRAALDKQLESLQAGERVAQTDLKVGNIARVNLLRVQAALAEVQAAIANAQGQERKLRAQLAALMGMSDFSAPIAPPDAGPAAIPADAKTVPPGIQAAQSALTASQAKTQATRRAQYPQFFINGGWNRNAIQWDTRAIDTWQVILGMRLNLWSGGGQRSAIDAAQAAAEESHQRLQGAEDNLRAARESAQAQCLDKTGTLTENRLTVQMLVPFTPASSDELLRLAALASEEATQDPINLAILAAAREKHLLDSAPERVEFKPFDPAMKRSDVFVTGENGLMRIVKVEPATVGALAGAAWADFAPEVARLSADGSRVLAVATGTDSGFRVSGLIALADPARADSPALIAELRRRGVRILLVTVDGEETARAVADQVGIEGETAPAGTIREGMDAGAALRYSVFARVFPEEKFRLVQALQNAGHVVGMTGDGVNDAPALKQADVGIAVEAATDVAKAAASLVLTRPGLGAVVMAVDGSRRIYQRMKTFVLTMNVRKIGIPLFLSLGTLAFGAFVQSPVQMILLMLFADVSTVTVSMDEVVPSRTPDRWDVRPLMFAALGFATLLVLMSGAVYWAGTSILGLGASETRTLTFAWLIFAGSQAVLYLTRVRGFFWSRPHPAKALNMATLLVVILTTLMATQGWLMAPLPPSLVGAMLLLTVAFLFVADQLKVALTRLAARCSVRTTAPNF